jgi:hypothetical protein
MDGNMGRFRGGSQGAEGGKKVSKGQQDRDNKEARLGLKWGKCGGVTEHKIGVLAAVSLYIPIGYKRFSMRGLPHFS